MSRFSLDITGAPDDAFRCGPEVGDVYKKDGGPAGFMLIVADNGSTHSYLAFNTKGEITGVGQGNAYYFARRAFVGRVEEFPPLAISWEVRS